jgi:vitamin B12 transporter
MHRPFIRTALAVAVASTFNVSSYAADEAAVIVTATRQAQRANELLSDVTVIGREQLDQAGQSTLVDLLAQQPGIEMATNGGPGSTSSIYMRGANSGHTLVLIDGLRVGSATFGDTNLSRIPLSQIDHVEILRGPASALYGSDAVGGVIQIFTRRAEGAAPTLNASLGYGTYNTREATAGVAGSSGDLSYVVNAGSYKTDGFSNIANPSSTRYFGDRDGYGNDSLSAKLDYRISPIHEVGASVFYSTGVNHYDNSGLTSPASYDYRDDHTLASAGLHLTSRFTPDWRSTVRIGHSYDDSTDYSTSTQSFKFRTDQTQFAWQNDVALPLGKGLLAVERLEEKVGPANSFARTTRSIDSLIAGWSARIDAHRVQADLRSDNNSQFGHKTTGLLAYGHQFAERWRSSLSYGTAFKAPSFNDLYFTGPGGVNNPNLRPESARNAEAGLHYEDAQVQASATYYDNRIKDLIAWAPTGALDAWGFDIWAPQNINRAHIKGLTLAYRRTAGSLIANASADFQNPRNEDTGLLLEHRSRAHGSAALDYTIGRWRAGAEWMVSGYRYDDAGNTRRMGGYALLNLRGSYQIDKKWSAFARVNNLFDRQYELVHSANFDGTVNSFGTPGTNVFVGLRYAP